MSHVVGFSILSAANETRKNNLKGIADKFQDNIRKYIAKDVTCKNGYLEYDSKNPKNNNNN